jgi:hypothetical protein
MSEISLQHAERILTSARQFQAVLKVVRARELFAGEGAPVRAKLMKQSDWNRYSSGRQDQLEMIHVKLNRIESVRAEYDALVEALPLTKKLFGETLYDVIYELVKIYEQLESVTKIYRLKLDDNSPEYQRDYFLYAYGIDGGGSNTDRVTEDIDRYVKIVEETCEAHLKSES